ncbi:MAG: hypothetical protein PHT40_03175 [Patescibacteria group bacterium]|nr:hypothetical protein [Patescibacteria group bacterium]
MKPNDFKKIIIVIGVLAVVFMATAIISAIVIKRGGKIILPWVSGSDQKVDLVQVQSDYRSRAKEVIKNYLEQDVKIGNTNYDAKAANAASTIGELLKLTLTKEEKAIQLELVLALSDAERGWQLIGQEMKDEGQGLLDKSSKELKKIMGENEWLK